MLIKTSLFKGWVGVMLAKATFICLQILFHVMQSYIFSSITPVFSVTWSFRNHSNMKSCYLRNINIIVIINLNVISIITTENCCATYCSVSLNVFSAILNQMNAFLVNKKVKIKNNWGEIIETLNFWMELYLHGALCCFKEWLPCFHIHIKT